MNDGVARIDDVEGDQPREHGRGDQDPDVKRDDGVDEPEKRIHSRTPCGEGLLRRIAARRRKGKGLLERGRKRPDRPRNPLGPPTLTPRGAEAYITPSCAGAVAQLGERRNRTAEVRGSNPLGSTSLRRFAATAGKPEPRSGEGG